METGIISKRKQRGKVEQPSQYKGFVPKSQGNCRSTPALGPVSLSLLLYILDRVFFKFLIEFEEYTIENIKSACTLGFLKMGFYAVMSWQANRDLPASL